MEDNYKLLLVDDESDILEFMSYNFRREGYEVFTAPNGESVGYKFVSSPQE